MPKAPELQNHTSAIHFYNQTKMVIVVLQCQILRLSSNTERLIFVPF